MIISLKITKIIVSKSLVIMYNTYHTKDKKIVSGFCFRAWNTFGTLLRFWLFLDLHIVGRKKAEFAMGFT